MNTLIFNHNEGTAELRFDAKPNPLTLRRLKEYGWRWDSHKRAWLLTHARSFQMVGSQLVPLDGWRAAVGYALGAAGLPVGMLDAMLADRDAHAHTAGVRGMEEANGIS
jgi:hypothetical protein